MKLWLINFLQIGEVRHEQQTYKEARRRCPKSGALVQQKICVVRFHARLSEDLFSWPASSSAAPASSRFPKPAAFRNTITSEKHMVNLCSSDDHHRSIYHHQLYYLHGRYRFHSFCWWRLPIVLASHLHGRYRLRQRPWRPRWLLWIQSMLIILRSAEMTTAVFSQG